MAGFQVTELNFFESRLEGSLTVLTIKRPSLLLTYYYTTFSNRVENGGSGWSPATTAPRATGSANPCTSRLNPAPSARLAQPAPTVFALKTNDCPFPFLNLIDFFALQRTSM